MTTRRWHPSRLVRDGEHHHEVRDVAEGDEGLLAVDHPLVAVADGGGPDVARVRAGAGLGDREAADLVAVDRRQEVALLLLVVGAVEDVVGVAAEAERHEGPAELRLDQGRHHRAERHPAVLLGRLHAEEARLLGLGPQGAELLARQPALVAPLPLQHRGLQRHHLAGDEGPHPVPDLALLVTQAQVHDRTLGRVADCATGPGTAPRTTQWRRDPDQRRACAARAGHGRHHRDRRRGPTSHARPAGAPVVPRRRVRHRTRRPDAGCTAPAGPADERNGRTRLRPDHPGHPRRADRATAGPAVQPARRRPGGRAGTRARARRPRPGTGKTTATRLLAERLGYLSDETVSITPDGRRAPARQAALA